MNYFGRDSLLSLRILAPIIKPEVIEAGIHGMAMRLKSDGQISHEENLGDMAYIK
jgi:hypothetical protein